MRRRINKYLVRIGSVFVLLALILTCNNVYAEYRAWQESVSALQELQSVAVAGHYTTMSLFENMTPTPDYLLAPGRDMPVVTVNERDYIGTISIPALTLALPVQSEWSYPNLKLTPCRYKGSAYTDDLIIAAHNYNSHFGRLKTLELGDEVSFMDVDGNLFYYKVVGLDTLGSYDVEEMEAGEWDLTLFTCTYGGQSRVTIRCARVDAPETDYQPAALPDVLN